MLNRWAKLQDSKGSTLVETALTLPILIMASLMLIQMAINFWLLSSQQQAANEAMRQYSLGYVDDESNGQLTPCSSVTGQAPSGTPSVEAWLCQRLIGIPGNFSVTASDGYPSSLSPTGSTLTISTAVETDSLLLFDLQGLLATLTAQHTSLQRFKE